jgi:hypothetical protein
MDYYSYYMNQSDFCETRRETAVIGVPARILARSAVMGLVQEADYMRIGAATPLFELLKHSMDS